MSTPVQQLRAARDKIDAATRAAAQADVLVDNAKRSMQAAVDQVAAFVPVAGKTHEQLVADLTDAADAADRDLAAAINTLDAALAAYAQARGVA